MSDRHAIVRKSLTGWYPANEPARAVWQKTPLNAEVRCEVSRPRNSAQHRLYWAVMQRVADNVEGVTAEGVSDVVKLLTGHTNKVQTRQGVVETPASIAWAKLSQSDFDAFMDRAFDVIRRRWLPHMSNAELKAELTEMVA